MSLSYEERVIKVLSWIHNNPAADLSLDNLADIALMSRFHWHRVFHAMTGETCAQAVRRIRLYRASTWLISSDLPIAKIGERVGYANAKSFNRAFIQAYSVSPVVFRKRGKPALPLTTQTKGTFTMFTIDIENKPELRLAALGHHGSYTTIGACFERLSALANQENLWPHVSAMAAVYYDDPNVVNEADLRSHAGLILGVDGDVPAALEEVQLPAGQCAVLHFKGAYDTIKVAYEYLYGDWLPKSGREPADLPPYELYLNNPEEVDESELLTDIVVHLK